MVKKNLEDERNKIGCLIENPALYMDMTARQNLEIQRTQRGIPGKSSIISSGNNGFKGRWK